MITGMQVRLARNALRWSVARLSEACGVSTSTIKRIEVENGVPNSTNANVMALKSALEAAGIEFIGTPEDRPGVRLDNYK